MLEIKAILYRRVLNENICICALKLSLTLMVLLYDLKIILIYLSYKLENLNAILLKQYFFSLDFLYLKVLYPFDT